MLKKCKTCKKTIIPAWIYCNKCSNKRRKIWRDKFKLKNAKKQM